MCQSFEYSDDEDQEEKKTVKDANESLSQDQIDGFVSFTRVFPFVSFSLAREVVEDAEFRNQLAELHSRLVIASHSVAPISNVSAFLQQAPSGAAANLLVDPWADEGPSVSQFQNSSFGVSDQLSSSFDHSVNGSNGSQVRQ